MIAAVLLACASYLLVEALLIMKAFHYGKHPNITMKKERNSKRL